jgi:hypothetical protein
MVHYLRKALQICKTPSLLQVKDGEICAQLEDHAASFPSIGCCC